MTTAGGGVEMEYVDLSILRYMEPDVVSRC